MLRVQGISFSYPSLGQEPREILKNVSFSAMPHEIISIMGPNGAGKTTLLKLLNGRISPTQGTIFLEECSLVDLPSREKAKMIAYVGQDPMKGTFPELSIEENLVIGMNRGEKLTLRPALTEKKRSEFQALFDQFSLPFLGRLKEPVGILSGGQRQILSLLMASLAPCKILILDEPTAALDSAATTKALEILAYLCRHRSMIVFMVTHDHRLADQISSRVLMLQEGCLVRDQKKKI
ncbi:MAG: ATP-binding cassette domain-containing protein [Alphaproteobacteria bacterium]|nr:ATP-binding cassette domain-containing protein [Alphaproteobacteria bacterium]